MRPYPSGNLNVEKTIFNKRLSRARVTIECAFAILTNKWRVSMKSIAAFTKHTKLIIKVATDMTIKILQGVRLIWRIETLLQGLGAIIELRHVPPPYEINTNITL
nr:unnamed protein product [Callosobruchus analis]